MTRNQGLVLVLLCGLGLASMAPVLGADPAPRSTARGDAMLADYFRIETRRLAEACLTDVTTLADWEARKPLLRRQLFEMLGLDPLPERTALNPVTTGKLEAEEFIVEKVHFQSLPGVYVTGNLYLPKQVTAPLPTILYVCGHGGEKKDGVSLGNKTHYQHHGEWYARHGYACLTIDTVQLGEIEGLHHGTSRFNMWWWLDRGYTPAGAEAWNCIRALDYLETRREVDPKRIGVTGRSGGGAYSWWIAALDERIQAAVPVAGITDNENHVVDGCVEGHCDCMYMVNTYRWDYATVAALVAPRPLLIANTDKDRIFPLEGVQRIHQKVRHIYRLYGADTKLGLQISEGPHLDLQELQVASFRWFNRFLKQDDFRIEAAAKPFFEKHELRVFDKLPSDERVTKLHEFLVPSAATPEPSSDAAAWSTQRNAWMEAIEQQSFRGWPIEPGSLDIKQAFVHEQDGIRWQAFDFTSQPGVRLRLFVLRRATDKPDDLLVLNVLEDDDWNELLAQVQIPFAESLAGETLPPPDAAAWEQTRKMFQSFAWGMAYIAPRGVGPTAFDANERKQIQVRRRFYLLGQTLDGMQAFDVRRAVHTVRSLESTRLAPLWLQGKRAMAGVTLYASLFEPNIKRLDLWHLPQSHREGPHFLNVLKHLDLPQAVALAAERSQVRLYQAEASGWEYPAAVAQRLGWDAKQLQVRALPKKQ